jgi:penicillin-binding protein 1A
LRYKEFGIRGALAGKTGTTQFNSDGLFIGMSPKFLSGTWVGCFDRRVSINSFRDGQGNKTALPIWAEFVKKLQADPAYNSYFYGTWPEEYEWIHDCPFTIEESELIELNVNPDAPRDSSYVGPRKYKLKDDKRSKVGQLLNDIFGRKNKKGEEQ